MKKKIFITLLFTVVVIVAGIFYGISLHSENQIKEQQDALAMELGVKITDFPYEGSFPVGYFSITLQPGMDFHEIHNIIRGYKKAYRCKSTGDNYYYSEVYYFFSLDDLQALRFRIFYDEKGRFKRLESEDDDSRTILIGSDCEPGKIINQPE